MGTENQRYQPRINLSGVTLPEHETEVFGLILKHMFDRYTQRIADGMKEPKDNRRNVAAMVAHMNKRRDTLVLMECFEGLREYPDPGYVNDMWVSINARCISKEMLEMFRTGCEHFFRDSQSDYHGKIACALKKHLTPKAEEGA